MRGTLKTALAALVAVGCAISPAAATSRIKDLANIEGIRQNQLIGYGLVVGLDGTGDTLNNAPFTKQSLQGMLERLGVNIRGQQIRTGNVAAAKAVGRAIAERAKAKGVTKVVFDRGGYLYHGRVKALAEAAREAGLQF